MSSPIENLPTARYTNATVVDHLGSNYVMGLLSQRVTERVEKLRAKDEYQALNERITYWENKFSPLDTATPEVEPFPETWTNIQRRLNMTPNAAAHAQSSKEKSGWGFSWPSFSSLQWSGAFAMLFAVVIGIGVFNQTPSMGQLSYVAVLEDNNQQPQVVAATYGDSKKLVLDIIELPEVDAEQGFELWVRSKTDNQLRSLGLIPKGTSNFDRELSDAEFRLIADSSFLIISIEDEGGSAMGEPSSDVISRGLCIRLNNGNLQS